MGEAMVTMAAWRLEDGRPWAEAATDWQIADAHAVLEPGPDDPRRHWLGRPKGGSKTTDVAGMGMAWLLDQAAPLDEGYVIASDGDQAKRLLKRAKGLLARTPSLASRLEVQSGQILNRRTGAALIALAADAPGAEGLVSPLILVDELPNWPGTKSAKDMWTAAFSSITKVPGMRFVVIGHAGIKGSWQHELYERFRASGRWNVRDVPGPLEWADPDDIAEQREVLVPSQFARRFLNEWSTDEDALTTVDDLRACVVLDGPMVPQRGVRYVVGLDLGLKNDRTVAAVCHAEAVEPGDPHGPGGDPFEVVRDSEADRITREMAQVGLISETEVKRRLGGRPEVSRVRPVRVVLDRMEVWQGSRRAPVRLDDVEQWVGEASWRFNRAPIVADPWQAAGLAQRLRARGVEVEEYAFGSASVGRLANVLHMLLRDRALALPDDPELLAELASVRIVERTPGVMRLDHDAGNHDDRAVAIALAAQRLLQRPPKPRSLAREYRNGALTGRR